MADGKKGVVVLGTGTDREYHIYEATKTDNSVVLHASVFNWVREDFEPVNSGSNLRFANTGNVRVRPINASGPHDAFVQFAALSGGQLQLLGIIESNQGDVILAEDNVITKLRQ